MPILRAVDSCFSEGDPHQKQWQETFKEQKQTHFGLLACSMVEVIHQWPRLKYPEMAILKMVGVTAVLFLAGLLPWVDNYAHLFGFVFGFLLAYGLLPFVTMGGGTGEHYDR